MSEDLFRFSWEVMKPGYEWLPHGTDDETGRYLTDYLTDEPDASFFYNPLEHTSLFRTFSETDPTPEGILEFANRYGLLIAHTRREEGQRDTYSLWQKTILSMRQVIELWDLIQKPDKKKLSEYFHLEESQVIRGTNLYFNGKPGQEISMSSNFSALDLWIPEEAMARVRHGAIELAALHFITLVLGCDGHLEGRVSPGLFWNTKRTQLQLRFVPRNLMGALWLQCAEMINDNKTYQPCKQCNKLFEISQKEMNKGKAFCSNACRSKAHRERQLEAQRLHTDGVSIKSIASRLDSDEKTIEGWINEGKR